MDVIEAIHTRRTVRAYEQRSLPREVLVELVWDAAQAPPPAIRDVGRWAFVAVEGVARLADFGHRAKAFALAQRPAGASGGWLDDPAFKIFWDAPALILICGLKVIPEAAWDCCRAGQNLMLSAHGRGLGACWVGSPLPWLRAPEGASACGIPDGFEAVAPIVVGYPAATPAPRQIERPQVVWG
jgi:nitroreductase